MCQAISCSFASHPQSIHFQSYVLYSVLPPPSDHSLHMSCQTPLPQESGVAKCPSVSFVALTAGPPRLTASFLLETQPKKHADVTTASDNHHIWRQMELHDCITAF